MTYPIRIGTAGWSIPRIEQDHFPSEGTHLGRYAKRFAAVEINSSFYRPHRRETYQRWAASVGREFRFAVKMPRTITHDRRLIDIDAQLHAFANQIAGLGDKLGLVLIQFPPSFALEPARVIKFFNICGRSLPCRVVLEPRHRSWFSADANAMLLDHEIARVAADPAPVSAAALLGGWHGMTYFRLHGTPRIYWSGYGPAQIDAHAAAARRAAEAAETWAVYDNTAAGCATVNALSLRRKILVQGGVD